MVHFISKTSAEQAGPGKGRKTFTASDFSRGWACATLTGSFLGTEAATILTRFPGREILPKGVGGFVHVFLASPVCQDPGEVSFLISDHIV